MSEQLKPCPFCGGEPYRTRAVNGTEMFYVGCSSCSFALKAVWYRGEPNPTKDIVAIWNQRTPSVAAPASTESERDLDQDYERLKLAYVEAVLAANDHWRSERSDAANERLSEECETAERALDAYVMALRSRQL